jgi:hypothetical protein
MAFPQVPVLVLDDNAGHRCSARKPAPGSSPVAGCEQSDSAHSDGALEGPSSRDSVQHLLPYRALESGACGLRSRPDKLLVDLTLSLADGDTCLPDLAGTRDPRNGSDFYAVGLCAGMYRELAEAPTPAPSPCSARPDASCSMTLLPGCKERPFSRSPSGPRPACSSRLSPAGSTTRACPQNPSRSHPCPPDPGVVVRAVGTSSLA